uniref:Uncharacterized protein G65A3.070 n=1 Tax=Neurospora crassa TaxID=5141 RepID=Q96TX9_NEUCS|nr:putative protein [Neurospora crassa]
MSTNSEPASTGNLPAFSISLTQHPHTDHPFSRRYIVLDKQNPTLKIGRSSKLAAKGFVPSSQNGWYDSPVMSRQHAEIIADFTQKRLKLRDLGSLHGTYINKSDQRLEKDEQVEIKDGDNIRFGVDVMRKTTFPPTIVKVGLEYIEVPKAKLEQDTTRPRASSTFKVPDVSDSDMEYQDEDSNIEPPGTQAAARGLSGRSWKGEVIDLTYPVGSGNVITDPRKQVIDVDQDDEYESDLCHSDKINDSHQNHGSHSKSDIASIPSPKSPIGSNDSNCSNYGSSGEDVWPQNVGAIQPTASQAPSTSLHVPISQHPVPSQCYAALGDDDDDDWDSEMSSDYEPEYEPESANSEVSGGDLNGGFEYDYPYSESDSDFSAGQDSDAESEAEEVYGREPSSNWAMPDFSNVVTGPSSIIYKDHSTARLVTPDIKDDVIDRAILQVPHTTPADMRPASYPVDSPLFLSFTHPRDVQLATPKSNKSAGDIDDTSPINKPLNGPLEMEEAPWYPSDKAKFFEARKENRMTIMQSSPVTREYSRLAISDIMDENAPVGKGKRKAEAISSSTEEDLAWQASEVQKPEASGENKREELQEVVEVDKDMEVGDLIEPSTEAATAITMTVESLDLPVSVVTSTVRLDDDGGDRPTKRQRLRNIAERVGYVALGGVATGAMMFGALVYTAPTFV